MNGTFPITNLTDAITVSNVLGIYGSTAWKMGRYATSSVADATTTFTVDLEARYIVDTLTLEGFYSNVGSSPTYIKVELYDSGAWTQGYLAENLTQAKTYTVELGGKIASKIRITATNTATASGVSLTEVKCSGKLCKTQHVDNVLLGKTVTQNSGTAENSSLFVIGNLTDGVNISNVQTLYGTDAWKYGRYATKAVADATSMFTVDLGARYTLGTLTVEGFYSNVNSSPTYLKVELYDRGEWTQAYLDENLAQAISYTVDLSGKNASKIRITATNTATASGVSLTEIMLDAETVTSSGFDRTAGIAAVERLVSYINEKSVSDTDRNEALEVLDEARVALGNTAGSISELNEMINKVGYFLDNAGKRDAFFDLVGKENIIIDYNFDTVVDVSANYNYVSATGDRLAPCFTGDSSATQTRVQLVNSAGGLEFVERQGGYALLNGAKDKIGTSGITLFNDNNGTTQSYIDNLSDRRGESFVVEVDVKGGVSMYNKPLMSVVTRGHSAGSNAALGVNLIGIWGSGELYPWGQETTIIGRLSQDKYTSVAAYVNLTENKYYIYIDGECVTPTGYTFLSDTDKAKIAGTYTKSDSSTVTYTATDFTLGEARIFHNDDIHGNISFDNAIMYYTDRGYISRASAECWYTPLGIEYNGVNYTYADKKNEWVQFSDGWRYFDEGGNMQYGDTVFSETTLEFSDKGVLNGTPCEGTNHIYSAESGKCTLCGAYEDGMSALGGISVTLKDNCLINFYLELDSAVLDADGAYVDIDGEKIPVSDGKTVTKDNKTYYVFTYGVAAKDISKSISLKVVNGSDVGGVHTYSVQRYIDTLRETETEATTLALLDSLERYGAYAKDFFDGGDSTMTALTDTIVATTPTKEGSVNSFAYYKTTLMLESTTAIRHYFKGNADGLTVEGGTLVKESDNIYFVEVSGIIPSNLDTEYEIGVKASDSESISIRCSVLAYAKIVSESESTEQPLKNLMRALYLYGNAAKDYTGE